jgi:hypothetical protein
MMGGVSPETCWALYKYEIKILIHCCILLDILCELYYDARIHKHQIDLKNLYLLSSDALQFSLTKLPKYAKYFISAFNLLFSEN